MTVIHVSGVIVTQALTMSGAASQTPPTHVPCAMCHYITNTNTNTKTPPPLHLSVVIFIIFIKTIIHPHHVNIHVSSIVIVQKSNCLDVSYRVDFAPFCQILSEICKFRDNDGITVLQQLSSDFPQWQWRAAGVW